VTKDGQSCVIKDADDYICNRGRETRLDSTAIESSQATTLLATIHQKVTDVVAIRNEIVETLLVALLARGHAMIEGIPGIGKTLLARTLARCLGCDFNRVQFTNDLMPSDIVGTSVWQPGAERFQFVKGPLFTNIVLADEINRTSPRTLSCLLEAMEQGKCSVEGRTVSLGEPFIVLATRNPIEFHGTYPIPEAAMDRFLVRVELTYPSEQQEVELFLGRDPEEVLAGMTPVIDRKQLFALMDTAQATTVREPVVRYAYRVAKRTRHHDAVGLGASTRAVLMWLRASRARAFMAGRDFVLPDDLKHMARPVLAHRIFMKGSGDASEVLQQIMAEVPVEL
jgi:MoxR-like ATPase